MSRRNIKVTQATVAAQTGLVQPMIFSDVSQFRVKTYDSKLKKVMSEQWPVFASYPEDVQNTFINYIAAFPDQESLTSIDISNDSTNMTLINFVFKEQAPVAQSTVVNFIDRFRTSYGSQLNIYLSETDITSILNQIYGAEALVVKPIIMQFIQGLRSAYGKPYIDINGDGDIMELVNIIHKYQEQNPETDFGSIINAVMVLVSEVYKSGDHFIWSVPPMTQFEEKMQDNIKKEFATLEGIEIFSTDASGNRTKIACRDCGNTSWILPPRMHKGRGDEIMHVKGICKECGRPMRNV